MRTARSLLTALGAVILLASLIFGALWIFRDRPQPQMSVPAQMNAAISNFGLSAIYPIREDVFVGDAFLSLDSSSLPSGTSPFSGILSRRVGNIELLGTLNAYYSQRPSLPASKPSPDNLAAPWDQPINQNGVFTPEKPVTRGRLAALPAINIATIRAGQVGGTGAFGGISMGFGAGGQGTDKIAVSFSAVEEVSLPENLMLEEILKFCESTEGKRTLSKDRLKLLQRQIALPGGTENGLQPDGRPGIRAESGKFMLTFISRVLYARIVEITLIAEQGAIADASASVRVLQEGIERAETLAASIEGKAAAGPATANEPGQQSAFRELRKNLSDLRANFGSGGQSAVGTLSFSASRGLTMKQMFERPLAFAVSGLTFAVNDFDTDVTGCNLSQSSVSAGTNLFGGRGPLPVRPNEIR